MSAPRPRISPPPPGAARPRWSVMIPTFDCAATLRATLASVLAQDPGPAEMQIEVVDDASTRDDPAAVVDAVGGGRVAFHRQPRNLGHVANFNSCLQRARGHLVHLLHGDDLVLPGFYAAMARPFAAEPAIGAAFCRHLFVDDDGRTIGLGAPVQPRSGVVPGWLETIAVEQRIQPPAMVVRRSAYERVGGFDGRIRAYGEDWEMWVRLAAAYPVWYEAEVLAAYRLREGTLSGRALRSGLNVRDFRTAIALNHALLPPAVADAVTRRALRATALSALRKGHRLLARGDLRTPLVQLREAVGASPTPLVGARAALLAAHWAAAGAAHLLGRSARPT